MSAVFPGTGYRPLSRRRVKTLCAWFDEINKWGWPKEIEQMTGRESPERGAGDNFRSRVMDAILEELGWRHLVAFRGD